ncbi:metallophosphoesterase family protein [Corynebacterium fournieri]|uniref:metallophosphoesterase family protein n=1 Tax=Corynebacterium fournieri TaxID=1852390 RepID=UPI000A2F7B17|nr:metallophosphoesterase [Corynebacterium fournieri]WJY98321.1 3',5'-cyclic adenosine monophosphate phosphodiesterase CpdA [Corynebacterium fournieri]
MTTRRYAAAATTAALFAHLAAPALAAQPEALPESARPYLYFESFDEVGNPAHFTHDLPHGWSQQVSGVTSGEARWNGWTLSDVRHWTWAAGTEQRHYFTQGHDQFAIIDSKQQRLAERDSMDARMTTAPIDVSGHTKIALEFDQHYRQGKKGQQAQVAVSFDGGKPEVVDKLTQDRYSSHEYFALDVPAEAKTMQVTFSYLGGNDDYWWAVDNVAVRAPFTPAADKPNTVIDVISDPQDDPEDYKLAIRRLNAMPDKASALVINGDLVDNGSQEQWEKFLTAREEAPHGSGVELWTIGNHEMYGQETSEVHMKRFLEHSGQEKPWNEVVVDGTPMLSINTEYYSDIDRGGKEPFQRISQEQLQWLDERLAHWDKQGVTALVFTHPLLPGTVSMSHSAWYQNDFEDEQAISDVLSKYNDVVAFTSHSHSSLKQNNWWGTRRYDGTREGAIGFPVVNTGAILNEYLPDGDHDEEIVDEQAATGLRVKIYDDRVRVEAWDFKDGHGPANPDGEAKLIKYQDFSKQKRVAASSAQQPDEHTSVPGGAEGSSTGEKLALVVGILAAVGGAFAFLAPRFQDVLGALGLPAVKF